METPCPEPRSFTLSSIGYVANPMPDSEVARNRRTLESEIVLEPAYTPALLGIEDYSHLVVLFFMDRAPPLDTLQYHPRGDPALPLTGVLASRGRNHPNPLGLAVVELLWHRANRLCVRRLDAFDGTPILDIKPYDLYDSYVDIRVPDWLAQRAARGAT